QVRLLAHSVDPWERIARREQAHLRVAIDDVRAPLPDTVPPDRRHVERIVDFLDGWRPETPLLVHCWAGISRSTATAFIAACLHNPKADEKALADALRAASPTAYPNTRIVAFADDILGRGGRMDAAVAQMGRGDVAEIAEPFHIPSVHRVP
ncbi:MAG: protein-tyrosine phosphatase family protein, partial [Pseudomonadota bacterium]